MQLEVDIQRGRKSMGVGRDGSLTGAGRSEAAVTFLPAGVGLPGHPGRAGAQQGSCPKSCAVSGSDAGCSPLGAPTRRTRLTTLDEAWVAGTTRPRSGGGAHGLAKVALCGQVALGDDEETRAQRVFKESTVRRRPRRRLSRGGAALVGTCAVVAAVAACGGSQGPGADAGTTASPTTTAVASTTSSPSAGSSTIGQEAFAAYQQAFTVIAQVAGSSTGVSTDPRLARLLMNPWYLEVVQQINVYRLRDEIVKGTYSFSNFHLDEVTADGRVIFTDCQTNGQAVYNAKTGALVGSADTTRIPEQVVAYRSSASAAFKIADDNQGTATAGAMDACAQ